MTTLPNDPTPDERRIPREELTLPDGRRLVYYRFPDAAPRASPPPRPSTPPGTREEP